jgi:predicted TIM-barrel fold metal-dependent hydrolase
MTIGGAPRGGLTDVHAHFVTPEYVAEARAAGVHQPDGMPDWPEWSVEQHFALMEQHDIRRSVLSISTPGVRFQGGPTADDLARHVNDFAADLTARHQTRLGFLASLPLPDVDAAIQEAQRSLKLGAEGVILLTHYDGIYLGDPRFIPLWEYLNERRSAVLIHPTSSPNWEAVAGGRPRPMFEFIAETGRTIVDLIFNEVFLQFSDIRFVVPHCGSGIAVVADRIERFRTVLPGPSSQQASPIPVRSQLQNLWFDLAGTPFPDQVPALLRLVSEDRLLFGSDYCWTAAAYVDDQIAALDESQPPGPAASWRDLTSRNAEQWEALGRSR